MPRRLGNFVSDNYGTGFSYNVYDTEDTAPTIRTFCGGGQEPFVIEDQMETVRIKQANKQGYIECEIGGVADLNYPSSTTRRGRVVERGQVAPTLQTDGEICRIEKVGQISSDGSQYGSVLSEDGLSGTLSAGTHGYANNCVQQRYKVRKLTPKECWRLMNFDDVDFNNAAYDFEEIKGSDLLCCAKLKDAIEKQTQNDTETFVLNITNVLQNMGLISIWQKLKAQNENSEEKSNVNIVIEKSDVLGQKECAISITKCLENTEMLYSLITELDLHQKAIIVWVSEDNTNTEKYMKIIWEENLDPKKLFIILTLIKLIIESKTYTSTLQKVSIQGLMQNLENSENNMEKMQISNLKMEGMFTRVSSSQLYKQAGNSIVVSCLCAIFSQLNIKGVNAWNDMSEAEKRALTEVKRCDNPNYERKPL